MDIYCDEIIPRKKPIQVLIETTQVLAFEHTDPYWTTHIVVIPKKHIESLGTVEKEDFPILNEMIQVASELCRALNLQAGGCRLSTNVGSFQTSKHLHFYIHSGDRLRNEDGSRIKI